MPEPATTHLDLDKGYLRTAQAAAILHVNTKTVSRWAKEGRLPCIRTLGGHRRFEERAIRELAASMIQPATDGPAAAGGRA